MESQEPLRQSNTNPTEASPKVPTATASDVKPEPVRPSKGGASPARIAYLSLAIAVGSFLLSLNTTLRQEDQRRDEQTILMDAVVDNADRTIRFMPKNANIALSGVAAVFPPQLFEGPAIGSPPDWVVPIPFLMDSLQKIADSDFNMGLGGHTDAMNFNVPIIVEVDFIAGRAKLHQRTVFLIEAMFANPSRPPKGIPARVIRGVVPFEHINSDQASTELLRDAWARQLGYILDPLVQRDSSRVVMYQKP